MILNELTNDDAVEAAWEEAWEANLKQVIALIDKGLSGEQLKQALQRDCLRMLPRPPEQKTPSVSCVSVSQDRQVISMSQS
jgi:hypothetical protein